MNQNNTLNDNRPRTWNIGSAVLQAMGYVWGAIFVVDAGSLTIVSKISIPCGVPGLPLYMGSSGIHKTICLLWHGWTPSVHPSMTRLVEKSRGSPDDRGSNISPSVVGAVMNRNGGWHLVVLPHCFMQKFVVQATFGLLRINRKPIVWRLRWWWSTMKSSSRWRSHSCGVPGLPLYARLFWNP